MDVKQNAPAAVARIAAAIGEPARARMLFCLMDGRPRTGTELAAAAEVSLPTASVHLSRLKSERLVRLQAQGKQRYYSLNGPRTAGAIESLAVLAGASRAAFPTPTPHHLRAARSCYDHLAGTLGVALHDRLKALGWISAAERSYRLTAKGTAGMERLGIDIDSVRKTRRRFACPCLDWSERRPHIGGALGAAILTLAVERKWVARQPDSRALTVTNLGRRALRTQFGIQMDL